MLINKQHWALWQPVFTELGSRYGFDHLSTQEGLKLALREATKRVSVGSCYGEQIFSSTLATVEIEFHKTGYTKGSHLNILSVVLANGPILAVTTQTSLRHAGSGSDSGCNYWNVLGEHGAAGGESGKFLLERCCHLWEVEETNRHAVSLSRHERAHVVSVATREKMRLHYIQNTQPADREANGENISKIQQGKTGVGASSYAWNGTRAGSIAAFGYPGDDSPEIDEYDEPLQLEGKTSEQQEEVFQDQVLQDQTGPTRGKNNDNINAVADRDLLFGKIAALERQIKTVMQERDAETSTLRDDLTKQKEENAKAKRSLEEKASECDGLKEELDKMKEVHNRARGLMELFAETPGPGGENQKGKQEAGEQNGNVDKKNNSTNTSKKSKKKTGPTSAPPAKRARLE